MVNSDEFAVRIKNLMEEYELSATDFADKVNVGRSSISHILSGRNKPSLDFIMKVLEAFPEIDLYWLMNGESERHRLKHKLPSQKTATPSPSPSVSPSSATSQERFAEALAMDESGKTIKRIIIFYEDGSFESYSN